MCTAVAAFIEQSPHKSKRKQSAEFGVPHSKMFDHKRDLAIKSFRPVFVNEFGDTDMRLHHKACALLLEQSLTAVSRATVLFSDMCNLLQLPVLNFFWTKQYPHYVIEMEDHTLHMMIGQV
jgi:hypothetical protein